MSEIKHILLIPTEGDPHGLLKEGPCGARPPMAWYCDDYQAWEQWHRGMDHAEPCAWAAMVKRARCALVLAWDGKPARVGIYIAGIALGRLDVVGHGVHCALQGGHTGGVRWASNHLAEVGTFALLDAEGRAVKDSPAKGPQQEKTP